MTNWTSSAKLSMLRFSNRFVLVSVVLAFIVVALAARLERSASPLSAADNTLLGVTFGAIVPLLSYAMVARVARFGSLLSCMDEIACHGENRRTCVSAALAVGGIVSAMFCAVLSSFAVLSARAADDPRLVSDALTCGWVGALSGAVYAALFALGSGFGRQGGGRFVVLAADWILGSSTEFSGVLMPRGHVRNLLGGEPALGLSQPTATAALAVLGLLAAAFALWRTPP